MALDFNLIGQQVKQMGGALRESANDRYDRIAQARAALADNAADWQVWRERANAVYDKSPWLLAAPAEPLDARFPLPPCPATYNLAAVDGSQIYLDRHGTAECFLINLGLVVLRYGESPACRLRSIPQLHYHEDEVVLRDNNGRQYTMAGPLVHAERDTREGVALAELAATLPTDHPRIALQDGTLIRWSLSGLDPWVRDYFLNRYLDQGLARLREAEIATCSYISRPRAPEVTGLVRLITDPTFAKANQPNGSGDPYRGIDDRMLFDGLLAVGERSALFKSLSKINADHYGDHAIYFFYLNVGRDLVRVELPEWVAADPDQRDLVHAVVYDQAQRGGGYPAALARAHEQAVVRETDRRVFRQMLEATLQHVRLAGGDSLKAISKEYQLV